MRQALLLLCVLAVACGQQVGEDGYTDENRPYEFGFNIEGYQHRHEKKDENGIIMGEFGFITADGIYHVTVYATDENGDFKILKMKNIRVGFPPGTPLMPTAGDGASQGRGLSPKSTPIPTSTTIKTPTSTVNPKFTVASGCGSCKVPITTTRKPEIVPSKPPSAARGRPLPAAFPRAETPEIPDAGSQGGQPPAGGIFGITAGQIPGSNVIGGTPIGQVPGFGSLPNNGTVPFVPNNGNVPFIPNNGTVPFIPNNGTVPFIPNNGNVPLIPNNGTVPFIPNNGNVPFIPNNGTVPFVPFPGTGTFGQNNQSSGGIPFGQVPGTDILGQIPGGDAVFGGLPPSNQSSDTPITGQFPGTNGFGSGFAGVLPSNGSTGFPAGGIPIAPPSGGQYPIPGISGALPGGANSTFPSPIPGGVFGDVPIEPNSGKPPIGVEQPGLPNGITENDIKDLLYRFNYTAGYHGHHESGYRNGNKEGGYFANGRDGIGQRVNYLANQFGYQPNITFFELSDADTPKEETEKNAGLKGYVFEWFFRKRR